MEKEIIITADGSHTLAIPQMNVTYHSKHGAIQESKHVYIEAGFNYSLPFLQQPGLINIFEMGFGTGLNAFLTSIEAAKKKQKVYYVALEQYPLRNEEALQLNYPESLLHKKWFDALHECKWNEEVAINDFFTLKKEQDDIITFSISRQFNIIYYDAFSPTVQPQLWTEEIFKKLCPMLYPGGILVTYCSKSDVRRAMQAAGFIIEKIPGPRGKREMVRALK